MKVIHGMPSDWSQLLSEQQALARPTAVALGNYDGVHLGHQAILTQLQSQAPDLPLTLVTFEPTPREFFAPDTAPPRLTNLANKLQRLESCGVQQVVVLSFDETLAAMTANDFVQQVLVDGLQAQHVSVGEDYRYGAARSGDVQSLAQYPFTVHVQRNILHSSTRVSSTAIRACLLADDFGQAEQLLGAPYWISGVVVQGQQLGRTIGFPTMNIDLQGQRPPLSGVYVVTARLGGASYPAVANYGTRPSVDNGLPSLEVHVLDWPALQAEGNIDGNSDAYGQQCRVDFCSKLRNEQKFAGLDALMAQIAVDVEQARAWFAQHGFA